MTAIEDAWLFVIAYCALATVQPVKIKNKETVHSCRQSIQESGIHVANRTRTMYIFLLLNRGTVKARVVALRNPQQVLAKFIKFIVLLSVTPTFSKIFAR